MNQKNRLVPLLTTATLASALLVGCSTEPSTTLPIITSTETITARPTPSTTPTPEFTYTLSNGEMVAIEKDDPLPAAVIMDVEKMAKPLVKKANAVMDYEANDAATDKLCDVVEKLSADTGGQLLVGTFLAFGTDEWGNPDPVWASCTSAPDASTHLDALHSKNAMIRAVREWAKINDAEVLIFD